MKPQIFISHSSKDKYLIKFIKEEFERIGVIPYFARERHEGKPLEDKLKNAIEESMATFVLFTPNVEGNLDTRDWVRDEVEWTKEIGNDVFVWVIDGVKIPRWLSEITDYQVRKVSGKLHFDVGAVLKRVAREMGEKAKEICKKGKTLDRGAITLQKPKLNVKVNRHGIINNYLDQQKGVGNSKVEILLMLSNSGDKSVGISDILVESKNRDYSIAISTYEYGNNWKNFPIYSIRLEPEETKMVMLHEEGKPTISMDNEFVEAEIQIYDTEHRIMKSIPIKLGISSCWGISSY